MKWRNGTRLFSEATCDTSAMSCASCTLKLLSMASPHPRTQHGVAVVAVDAQRLARQRAAGDVDGGREQLAGDLVEVGNVQEQPLAGRKGRGQRARDEGAVQGAGCVRLVGGERYAREQSDGERGRKDPIRV